MLLERKRLWRLNNPEAVKAMRRRHYEKHSDLIKRKAKEWYEANKDRAKKRISRWYGETRADRISARYTSNRADRAFLSELYKRGCAYCKKSDSLEVDHITPKSKGGLNSLSNLQWLCHTCNRAKHALSEKEFFSHIELILRNRQ